MKDSTPPTFVVGHLVETYESNLKEFRLGKVVAIGRDKYILVKEEKPSIEDDNPFCYTLFACDVGPSGPLWAPYVFRTAQITVGSEPRDLSQLQQFLQRYGFSLDDPGIQKQLFQGSAQTEKFSSEILKFLDRKESRSDSSDERTRRAHNALTFMFSLTQELQPDSYRTKLRLAFIKRRTEQLHLLDPYNYQAWVALQLYCDREYCRAYALSAFAHPDGKTLCEEDRSPEKGKIYVQPAVDVPDIRVAVPVGTYLRLKVPFYRPHEPEVTLSWVMVLDHQGESMVLGYGQIVGLQFLFHCRVSFDSAGCPSADQCDVKWFVTTDGSIALAVNKSWGYTRTGDTIETRIAMAQDTWNPSDFPKPAPEVPASAPAKPLDNKESLEIAFENLFTDLLAFEKGTARWIKDDADVASYGVYCVSAISDFVRSQQYRYQDPRARSLLGTVVSGDRELLKELDPGNADNYMKLHTLLKLALTPFSMKSRTT